MNANFSLRRDKPERIERFKLGEEVVNALSKWNAIEQSKAEIARAARCKQEEIFRRDKMGERLFENKDIFFYILGKLNRKSLENMRSICKDVCKLFNILEKAPIRQFWNETVVRIKFGNSNDGIRIKNCNEDELNFLLLQHINIRLCFHGYSIKNDFNEKLKKINEVLRLKVISIKIMGEVFKNTIVPVLDFPNLQELYIVKFEQVVFYRFINLDQYISIQVPKPEPFSGPTEWY